MLDVMQDDKREEEAVHQEGQSVDRQELQEESLDTQELQEEQEEKPMSGEGSPISEKTKEEINRRESLIRSSEASI